MAADTATGPYREYRPAGGPPAAAAGAVFPARESEAEAPVGPIRAAVSRSGELPRRSHCRRRVARQVFRYAIQAGSGVADAVQTAEGDRHGFRGILL